MIVFTSESPQTATERVPLLSDFTHPPLPAVEGSVHVTVPAAAPTVIVCVPEVVPFMFKTPVEPTAPRVSAPAELSWAFVKSRMFVPTVVPLIP